MVPNTSTLDFRVSVPGETPEEEAQALSVQRTSAQEIHFNPFSQTLILGILDSAVRQRFQIPSMGPELPEIGIRGSLRIQRSAAANQPVEFAFFLRIAMTALGQVAVIRVGQVKRPTSLMCRAGKVRTHDGRCSCDHHSAADVDQWASAIDSDIV